MARHRPWARDARPVAAPRPVPNERAIGRVFPAYRGHGPDNCIAFGGARVDRAVTTEVLIVSSRSGVGDRYPLSCPDARPAPPFSPRGRLASGVAGRAVPARPRSRGQCN
jgi:hypothetical protein